MSSNSSRAKRLKRSGIKAISAPRDLGNPLDDDNSVVVVVPTRNRPTKLARCLAHLQEARKHQSFAILICDSTPDPVVAAEVQSVVAVCASARYQRHDGANVAAARNCCIRESRGGILVNVDDDVYVEPEAIRRLVAKLRDSPADAVVAGGVIWPGGVPSRPVKMRPIGYGRSVVPGEAPDFILGAFFAYRRSVACRWPWNERIKSSDDRFMGAVWRANGVALEYEPTALARHDTDQVSYDVTHQRHHIYANLFDATLVRRSVIWTLSFVVVGFAVGVRGFHGRAKVDFVGYWLQGIVQYARDWRSLRASYIR